MPDARRELVDIHPGPVPDGWVRLKVTGCGICGSDLLFYRGMRAGVMSPADLSRPRARNRRDDPGWRRPVRPTRSTRLTMDQLPELPLSSRLETQESPWRGGSDLANSNESFAHNVRKIIRSASDSCGCRTALISRPEGCPENSCRFRAGAPRPSRTGPPSRTAGPGADISQPIRH